MAICNQCLSKTSLLIKVELPYTTMYVCKHCFAARADTQHLVKILEQKPSPIITLYNWTGSR